MNLRAGSTRKLICLDMPSQQPTEQPRTFPPRSRVSEHMPPRPSCVCLPECSVSRGRATGALEARKYVEAIRLAAWAVSYCTDQLMTPYFSGGSTINGTPGGYRWARVLGGQISWLSVPLHRVDLDCSGSTNLKMQTPGKHEKIPPHPKHTTKSTAARRPRPPRDGARRNTSRVLAHIRPLPWISGLTGLVQLSQSVKTTNVTHTHRQTTYIMAPCTHPGMKRIFCL